MNRFLKSVAAALILLAGLASPASAQVMSQFVNAQTGTTYTFLQSDCSKLVTFSSSTAVAVTLPQAGTAGAFFGGCFIDVQNKGLGTVTITPATSTINGSSTWILTQNQSVRIVSDATNYQVMAQGSGGATGTYNNFRNLVDNGGMNVQQRGTGTITCAQNAAITAAAYSADRWGCSVNVASGAGRQIALTTGVPTGFTGAQQLFRTSGALTQPVCSMQAIPTANATTVQGKKVVLSFYAQALAGLSADNGNVITANVITGTGTDQGFASMTASPAITPAWTGVATPGSQNFTITTSWVRYQTTPITLGSTVSEIAVAMCFTPTATGAGATDGFNFTGVQLEQSDGYASPYEFRSFAYEYANAQRYYWQVADGAATVSYPSTCNVTTANTTVKCVVNLPVTMRAAPTTTVGTAQSFGIWLTAGTAGTCTTLAATASSNTVNGIGVTCTTGGTIALGTGTMLIGAATGGILSASADF